MILETRTIPLISAEPWMTGGVRFSGRSAQRLCPALETKRRSPFRSGGCRSNKVSARHHLVQWGAEARSWTGYQFMIAEELFGAPTLRRAIFMVPLKLICVTRSQISDSHRRP